MAAIQVDGKAGKRPVDHEIPLIPFIDLLLCCVMFLLTTAVWTQLSSLQTNQQRDGGPTEDEIVVPSDRLILQVSRSGFVLASTAGDRIEIPATESGFDLVGLRQRLDQRRELAPNERAIVVAPEDGISYEDVIHTMDAVTGAGFTQMSLADGALM
jgi:biopolymer transport protein ExbD